MSITANQEPDYIARWSDDPTVRGVKQVQKEIVETFHFPKAPSEKTIYKAAQSGALESWTIWRAYHFSLRGIARWIYCGGLSE